MPRRHDERLSGRSGGGHEAKTQKSVYQFFERRTGTAAFFFKQAGDVVIEGQRSSHIMMLSYHHHDVKRMMTRCNAFAHHLRTLVRAPSFTMFIAK